MTDLPLTDAAQMDENERKFLHDLANPLAIAYGNLRLLYGKMEKDINAVPIEAIRERLTKIINNFDRANDLLDQRRKWLRERDTTRTLIGSGPV